MNPPWWGIPIILVVGAAVIIAGWWWDRRRYRQEAAGFVTADDFPTERPTPPESDADVAALLASRTPEPSLPAGLADASFLTHGRLAVATAPLVLVTDADVSTDALLLPALTAAQQASRPLVVVAPDYHPDVLASLHANHITGRVPCLPVELADPDLLARAAAACHTRVTPDADLRSGWWPSTQQGSCAAWIADADDSWIIDESPST